MTAEQTSTVRQLIESAITQMASVESAGYAVGVMVGVYFCQGPVHSAIVSTNCLRPHDPTQVQEDIRAQMAPQPPRPVDATVQ